MARRRRGKPVPKGDPRERGFANLKPAKPGEVRNPTGKNGHDWLNAFRDFFGAPPDKADQLARKLLKASAGDSRYTMMLRALFRNVVMGSDQAIKLATEQLNGRARQHVEMTGPGGTPLAPGVPVTLYLPDNKRGPVEKPKETDDGDPGSADEPPAAE